MTDSVGVSEEARQLVLAKIKNVEERYNVKVLYAIEEGSRASGLASPDSDYDIRFIYIPKVQWYFSVDDVLDEIREKDDTNDFDLLGWELRKSLRLLRKSNPQIYGWLFAGVVYLEEDPCIAQLRELAMSHLNLANLVHNFHRIAHVNWVDYIKDKKLVNQKRYLYIIRSLLSAMHIRQYSTHIPAFPPTEFPVLLQMVTLPEEVRSVVELLFARKKTTSGQWGEEPRIEVLDKWLMSTKKEIKSYADGLTALPRTPLIEMDTLNAIMEKQVFRYSM